MFHAAEQNRIVQEVVDPIQETIDSGRLKLGDTPPAERESKEMRQVSCGTLMAALRALAHLTGNPVPVSLHHAVHDNIHQYHATHITLNDRERIEKLTHLRDLITAIKDRRVDDAGTLARRRALRFNPHPPGEATPPQPLP